MHCKAITTLTSSGSDIIESISALHGRIYSENAEPNYIYYSKDQSESNLVLLNASNAQIREQNLALKDNVIATYYMHLDKINDLNVDDYVSEDDTIGFIGNTGIRNTFTTSKRPTIINYHLL